MIVITVPGQLFFQSNVSYGSRFAVKESFNLRVSACIRSVIIKVNASSQMHCSHKCRVRNKMTTMIKGSEKKQGCLLHENTRNDSQMDKVYSS